MFESLLCILIGLCALTQNVATFSLRTVKQIVSFCLGSRHTIIHASGGSIVVVDGVVYPPKKIRGSGNIDRKELACKGISKVICNYGKVDIVQGNEDKLVIVADDNILQDYVQTQQNGEVIDLGLQSKTGENNSFENITLKFYLTLKKVSGVQSSHNGTVTMHDITSDSLKMSADHKSFIDAENIKCTGKSEIKAHHEGKITIKNIQAKEFHANSAHDGKILLFDPTASNIDIFAAHGGLVHARRLQEIEQSSAQAEHGGHIKLTGTTKNIIAVLNHRATIEASELVSERCTVKCDQGSKCTVQVTEYLQGCVDQGSNVDYYGNPRSCNIIKGRGGRINKIVGVVRL